MLIRDVNSKDLLKSSSWIPTNLQEIRGLVDWDKDWFIYGPYDSSSGSCVRVIPKSLVDSTLIKNWKEKRDRLCRTLTPIERKNVKDLQAWFSAYPLPNYHSCMPKVMVLNHARALHSKNLGDCWLVRFESGRTSYIPSEMLYIRKVSQVFLLD
jgi:hypothetical protein